MEVLIGWCKQILWRCFCIGMITGFFFKPGFVYAQENFQLSPFSRFTLESSLTALVFKSYFDSRSGEYLPFYERHGYTALMLNLSKHWWAGLMYDQLWTRYKQSNQGTYFLGGPLLRWSFPIKKDVADFQIDGIVLQGNYCPCDLRMRRPNFPYRIENSWYGGGGFNLRFKATKLLRGIAGVRYYELISRSELSEPILHVLAGFQLELSIKNNQPK